MPCSLSPRSLTITKPAPVIKRIASKGSSHGGIADLSSHAFEVHIKTCLVNIGPRSGFWNLYVGWHYQQGMLLDLIPDVLKSVHDLDHI